MLQDLELVIECDECGETITVEPEFVYPNYSGKHGHYDTTQSGIDSLLPEGWESDNENDKHFCENCAANRE